MLKKLALFVFSFTVFLNANAQYAMGGDLNYKIFFDGGGMSNPSISLCFNKFLADGDVMFYSGIGFGFPKKFKSSLTAVATDMTNPVQTVSVDYDLKYTNFYCDLGIGKIFGGDYDDGGFMAYGGLATIISKYKGTIGTYDQSNYYLDNSGITQGMNMAYGLKLGLGYLIRTGGLGITPHADLTLPILNMTEGAIPTFISIGVQLSFYGD